MPQVYTASGSDATSLGRPELIALIRDAIQSANGFLSFEKFMELALYHSEFGYYAAPQKLLTGRKGDFITNVSVGSLFGQLLARQLKQMWEMLRKPSPFWMIEQGAMDAQLAVDILTYLRESEPIFFQSVRYLIIEPFEKNRVYQEEKIRKFSLEESVSWKSNLQSNSSEIYRGVFFSNELVDSFPVHRVTFKNDHWEEVGVGWNCHSFILDSREIENQQLKEAIAQLLIPEIPDYTTEINLRAQEWMQQVASFLEEGFVLTIDYGYSREEYYRPERIEGTLQTYYQHQRTNNPLIHLGEQDLTAHVNFTDLIEAGNVAGLEFIEFTDQHRFLTKLAAADFAEDRFFVPPDHSQFSSILRAWKTLTHPELMGTRFKYLLQKRSFKLA